jgi:hypothetical protein
MSGVVQCFIDMQALRARDIMLIKRLIRKMINSPSIPYKFGTGKVNDTLWRIA